MVDATPNRRKARVPVARARAVRTAALTAWILVVDRCPICRKAHTHGGGDGDEPAYGVRTSHCKDLDLRGGYDLQPAPKRRAA